MCTFNMTVEQSSCSFAKSNRLYGIWLAGVNWNDFHRTMQLEDIEVISVPLICQDIMKLTTSTVRSITENVPSKKKNDKKTAVSLRELSHLTLGIVKVFEYQVKFLFDQVLQGLVLSLSGEDNQNILSTNKTSLKRKGNAPGAKRVKRVKSISFSWASVEDEDVQDVEVDNETIMKVLQTSILMNKQEITMREAEDEPDTFTQTSEFEATDHSSMQLFNEIRELVAGRLSSDLFDHEFQSIRDKDDSAANTVENDSPMLAADISTQIEHPCIEFSNFVEPAPVEAILNESEALDLMPLIGPPNQFHKELPPQILKVLNLSESAKVSDTHWSTDSEKMLMLMNQKNRREWGEKGVMEHLFWLWNNNIYPISMKELTQSCQSRVAKALAFRSILELNSPRVGLIVIENKPNSNEIYNIAKSEKLNDLLQSIW